jgi:hypothetical protein
MKNLYNHLSNAFLAFLLSWNGYLETLISPFRFIHLQLALISASFFLTLFKLLLNLLLIKTTIIFNFFFLSMFFILCLFLNIYEKINNLFILFYKWWFREDFYIQDPYYDETFDNSPQNWKEYLFIYIIYFRLIMIKYLPFYLFSYNIVMMMILLNVNFPVNLVFSIILFITRFTLFLSDRNWSQLHLALSTQFKQFDNPYNIVTPTYRNATIMSFWAVRSLEFPEAHVIFRQYEENNLKKMSPYYAKINLEASNISNFMVRIARVFDKNNTDNTFNYTLGLLKVEERAYFKQIFTLVYLVFVVLMINYNKNVDTSLFYYNFLFVTKKTFKKLERQFGTIKEVITGISHSKKWPDVTAWPTTLKFFMLPVIKHPKRFVITEYVDSSGKIEYIQGMSDRRPDNHRMEKYPFDRINTTGELLDKNHRYYRIGYQRHLNPEELVILKSLLLDAGIEANPKGFDSQLAYQNIPKMKYLHNSDPQIVTAFLSTQDVTSPNCFHYPNDLATTDIFVFSTIVKELRLAIYETRIKYKKSQLQLVEDKHERAKMSVHIANEEALLLLEKHSTFETDYLNMLSEEQRNDIYNGDIVLSKIFNEILDDKSQLTYLPIIKVEKGQLYADEITKPSIKKIIKVLFGN